MKSYAKIAFLLPMLVACGAGAAATKPPAVPPSVKASKEAPAEPLKEEKTAERESPPPSAAGRPFPFPKVHRKTLPSGLEVATVEADTLPIVQIRLFVRAGMGFGGTPGVAEFTAHLLKDGGTRSMTSAKLLERIESLGTDLQINVTGDSTVLSLGVTKENLREALRLLGEVTTAPRFEEGEFKKLRARELDGAKDKARSSGAWIATRVLFRDLFAESNPYATYELSPKDIEKISLAKVREFHQKFFVPKNTKVILSGAVDADSAAKAVEEAFANYKGGEPPKVDFPPAIAPAKTRVVVADRPKSAQSDIYVTMLAPPRSLAEWPHLRLATQVLGGGPASRLFLDVREQRSLAYQVRASIFELAHGPEPIVTYAGTQTSKTAAAVQGLVDNIQRLQKEAPSSEETAAAGRFLSDIFAIRLETVGAIADLLVQGETLGLPDGYWDTYRGAVRSAAPKVVGEVAARVLTPEKALIVVAGDAELVAPTLTKFGDVTVVDPENDFKTIHTLPAEAAPPSPP